MSRTEFHIGTLIPINRQGEDAEMTCERLADSYRAGIEGWSIDHYSDYKEMISDQMHGEIFIHGETVYEVIDAEVEEHECRAWSREDDCEIDYSLSYYNGGCSFNEALGDAMKFMEENNAV